MCLQFNGIPEVPMQTLWQDLVFAARMLRKSPGFAAVSVLTLAVAIGSNAVVFSVMNSERLYTVERAIDGDSSQSYPNYLDLRDRNRSFSALAVHSFQHLGLDTGLWRGWELLRRLGHSTVSWPALSRVR